MHCKEQMNIPHITLHSFLIPLQMLLYESSQASPSLPLHINTVSTVVDHWLELITMVSVNTVGMWKCSSLAFDKEHDPRS